jgi:hypothetical protein
MLQLQYMIVRDLNNLSGGGRLAKAGSQPLRDVGAADATRGDIARRVNEHR